MAALEPVPQQFDLNGDDSAWKFHGGPNDGLKINFFPQRCQTQLFMGRDRYVVRLHDHTLLFSPKLPKRRKPKGRLSISEAELRFFAESTRLLDLVCHESEPLIDGQVATVPNDLIARAKKLFAPTP